jgi:hypothetical protein
MAAQHCVLVPEHKQFSILRPVATEHQDSQTEYRVHQQVDDLQQHPASQPSLRPIKVATASVIRHLSIRAAHVRLLYLCRRALKPEGIIVIVTPNLDVASVRHSIFWLDVTHQRPYPLPLLLHIFSALGLETVDSGCRQAEEERDLFIVGRVPAATTRL